MAVASPEGVKHYSVVAAARRVGVVAVDGITRRRVVQLLQSAGFDLAFQTRVVEALPDEGVVEAVVVADNGHGHSAAQQVRRLRAHFSEETLIAVVGSDDRRAAVAGALGAGARAYVSVDRLDEAFVPSLAAALAGQIVVPGGTGKLPTQALSVREKQVLALVVMGMTNAEIAGKLFLAESTVKSHLSSAFSKMGVRSRNEAAAMILDPEGGVGMGILTIPTPNESDRAS
jgi:DNA-binding NarL/FixJ family response regulator